MVERDQIRQFAIHQKCTSERKTGIQERTVLSRDEDSRMDQDNSSTCPPPRAAMSVLDVRLLRAHANSDQVPPRMHPEADMAQYWILSNVTDSVRHTHCRDREAV